MKVSIIMVNHNLGMWLKQAAGSLIKACKNIDYEMIVVDNASTDRSRKMLAADFPGIRVILNQKNEGIAKAYNQAIKVSRGEYVFLVNPDTITKKDTIQKLINFMDNHAAAGGASVRMVSPQGHFIASSKFGITSAWCTLLKWTGLAKYFPKSHLTKWRHEDWTEEFEMCEVDVLNGAGMLLRRSALNQTGLLDERFFMYGYDIDLSFRLKMEGFKNYYFPKTYIINFNVQQVSRFSWSYIRYFYGAMFIFVAKYLFEMPKISLKGLPQMYTPQYEVER
ncbi:glycosyltransferase family 2 protein [Mucilaginibacter hurinus]|uniref:Glycosyltransferase family 2 protein n=1 Tax=Mucilaginibacter hurinus TaxID=2201324 RepID=A0A367GPC5_9SPHI|nr:glycosyltransferase family 2 protein [Mucilaginibacter hurinus]RCH55150.1 glycosyltransferase family 2 protein [Mucilaginibacter hurinus]